MKCFSLPVVVCWWLWWVCIVIKSSHGAFVNCVRVTGMTWTSSLAIYALKELSYSVNILEFQILLIYLRNVIFFSRTLVSSFCSSCYYLSWSAGVTCHCLLPPSHQLCPVDIIQTGTKKQANKNNPFPPVPAKKKNKPQNHPTKSNWQQQNHQKNPASHTSIVTYFWNFEEVLLIRDEISVWSEISIWSGTWELQQVL